jgi:hypothetical protein
MKYEKDVTVQMEHPEIRVGIKQTEKVVHKWKLNTDGSISFDYYSIAKNRLSEPDWIIHLMDKKWFDLNDFMPVYFEACVRAKIFKVEILTQY